MYKCRKSCSFFFNYLVLVPDLKNNKCQYGDGYNGYGTQHFTPPFQRNRVPPTISRSLVRQRRHKIFGGRNAILGASPPKIVAIVSDKASSSTMSDIFLQ